MPTDVYLPADPMARFVGIYGALNADRGWGSDASCLRFAAMSAVTCRGEPNEVATAIRNTADKIKERSGWFGELTSSLRFIVSTMLVQNGDTPAGFLTEVERVKAMLREVGLRRGGIYETMAILILRVTAELEPVSIEAVRRFAALYEQMKRYHWWLTGPDDFPACAVLVGRDGSPEQIGSTIEQIFQALCDCGCGKGDPLQTAANLLYLADLEPLVAAGRFRDLADSFRSRGVSIWQSDYDELAILTFLDQPVEQIVAHVLDRRRDMEALRPAPGRSMTFNLAASIAFLELVQCDRDLKTITDSKALLDMQAIIAAQQAAAAAAASSAAAGAAASSS